MKTWSDFNLVARASSVLAVALTLSLGLAAPAVATWSDTGAGAAGGGAETMPTGTAPTGAPTGDSVTIRWTAARLPDGTPVAGYLIERVNAATGAAATVSPGCSGIVTATTCTESSVPPGTWYYTDTPVQLGWTGGQSPDSGPVTVALT
jgi:hypothetical protein